MTDAITEFENVDEHGGIEGFEPEFVDVDGTRTRYYDIGDGEPVVLVHGGNWSGLSSANIWSTAFEHLSDDFRVIAFDRIGCGMIDNPGTIEEFNYATELQHVLSFVDTLGLSGIHLVGSSRGAGLAVCMAVEEAARFDTLVMLNSGTFGPPTGDKSFRRDRIFERWRPEEFERTTPEYTQYRYTQYAHRTDYITDEFCRTNAYLRSRPKAEEMASFMEDEDRLEEWKESMREHIADVRRRIKNGALSIPILYIYGRNDLMVPLEMATSAFDVLAQGNSTVRMKIVNECGHIMYREYPEEFSQTIIDFVNQADRIGQ